MCLSGKSKYRPCLVGLGLLAAALGCNSPPEKGDDPEKSPPPPAVSPETAPQAPVAPPVEPQAGTVPAPSPGGKEVPQVLKELQEKLQPEGKAALKLDEATLKAEAEAFVKNWLEALQKGDVSEAEKFAVSSELLQKNMNAGYREILEGTVLSQNHLLMERLIGLLKGKDIRHEWKPGTLSETPARHIFWSSTPCLSSGILQVDASGIIAEIHLDQLFYIDKQWKIFRMSVP